MTPDKNSLSRSAYFPGKKKDKVKIIKNIIYKYLYNIKMKSYTQQNFLVNLKYYYDLLILKLYILYYILTV